MMQKEKYSVLQLTLLVGARVAIGWYCLYEGVIKLITPHWTSMPYLMDSQGFLALFFRNMATNPTLLSIVDFLNIVGLIAVGIGLILGILTRISTVSGILLIGLYALSHPSLVASTYILPSGDHTLWIDKNIVFLFLLLILLVFPTGKIIGLDRILFKKPAKA
ncbi:MAG TPA: DoxX family membrane protein [Prolixibacteraceae bacterium]|nr:DoxX family membrane protein [Prolixibacteraceae bacterium]